MTNDENVLVHVLVCIASAGCIACVAMLRIADALERIAQILNEVELRRTRERKDRALRRFVEDVDANVNRDKSG